MFNVLWGKNLNQSSISNAQVKCAVGEEGRLSFRNAVAVLAIVFCLHSNNSAAVTDDNIPFKIPQQRADTALTLFAEQANLTLVFPFDQVKDITANRLVGNYPIDTAINILLQDTGLMPTFSNQLVLNIAIDDKGKSMNKNTRKTLLASMVGLFAAGGLSTAAAQETESARAQGVLDEIIVTAEKREASLQEVPIAITAFTGKQLEDAGINDSTALELVTPGMSFLSVADLGVVTIRGVGSPFLQGSAVDPSTAIYVDGVYQPRFASSVLSLMDLERVEVLKGPQGVLYGRNSPGGAINYISKGPQDELGGSLSVQFGNYSLRSFQGQVDIPLVKDKLLLRGAIKRETRDGYSENLLIPSDPLENEDIIVGRLALKYIPTDNLDLTLRLGASDREGGFLPAFKPIRVDPTAPNAGIEIISDPRKIMADQPNYSENYSEYVDLTVNWDLGWSSFKSITSYQDKEANGRSRDVDGSELAIGHQGELGMRNGVTYDAESFSQEFLLASSGDNSLDWVLGLFYFEENPINRAGFDIPFINFFVMPTQQTDTEAHAIFGHISYDITEQLRLNAGLRYSSEDREITRTNGSNGVITAGPETLSDSWDAITPKLGLDYFVNDDVMVYASASRGFKSGGFSLQIGGKPLDEEIVDALEVGVKSTLLDGRLRLNVSAFDYDFKDMQVNSTDPDSILSTIRNAGSADIRGMEIEISALPVESLQLDVGLSFLDTEFTDFEVLVDPVKAPTGNLKGNELPNSPEFTANIGVKYFQDWDDMGRVVAQADYYYSSEVFHTEFNDQRGEDSYYNLNLRISLESLDETWRISAFGKNVTDELVVDYTIDSAFLFGDGYLAQYAPPRTYGVELTYQF